MKKQELIDALNACTADDDDPCSRCPGDNGMVCNYLTGNNPWVEIPTSLVKCAIDMLNSGEGDDYKRGLGDAWDAMRKISLDFDGAPSADDLKGLFGTAVATNIIRNFDLQTIMERLNDFSSNILKDASVGDEVQHMDNGQKFVVVRTSIDGSVYLMDCRGNVSWYSPMRFKKTGMHYGSLLRMLKMIGGGTDDAE